MHRRSRRCQSTPDYLKRGDESPGDDRAGGGSAGEDSGDGGADGAPRAFTVIIANAVTVGTEKVMGLIVDAVSDVPNTPKRRTCAWRRRPTSGAQVDARLISGMAEGEGTSRWCGWTSTACSAEAAVEGRSRGHQLRSSGGSTRSSATRCRARSGRSGTRGAHESAEAAVDGRGLRAQANRSALQPERQGVRDLSRAGPLSTPESR